VGHAGTQRRRSSGRSAAAGSAAATAPLDRLIQNLDRNAEGTHPLRDPKFPFRVWIKASRLDANNNLIGDERAPEFRGNDAFVPVRKGEVMHIYVETRSGQLVLLRLLVDGLNTLPQRLPDSQRVATPAKGLDVPAWAPRVNLNDARPWVLDPAQATVFAVRGFVTETEAAGKLRQFTVVDGSESLAARREFTDQLGIVTAAFYAPGSSSRGPLGVQAGRERTEDLTEREGVTPGQLPAVVHLRYSDAETLQRTR
jgi:hypothetical protein